MAEFVSNAVQNVNSGQDVLFTEDIIECCRGNVLHRQGSGIFTLRGNVNNPNGYFARYWVEFGANIAIPTTGGTVAPISIALAINGEAVPTSSAIVTPAAVGDYWNVNVFAYVTVPRGCCQNISVKNISTQAINVQNANIVINRTA